LGKNHAAPGRGGKIDWEKNNASLLIGSGNQPVSRIFA